MGCVCLVLDPWANASKPFDVSLLLLGSYDELLLLGSYDELLLLDEPSRGVDIGAKFEIHALTRRLAADGRAVLMASSEMEELCTVPDEVVVLCDGKIAGRLRKHQVNEQNIMTLATGGAFEAA